MAKKETISPLLVVIKTDAKHLQSQAKAKGENLIYGHALDQASKAHGYKDWNTASAMAKDSICPAGEIYEEWLASNLQITINRQHPKDNANNMPAMARIKNDYGWLFSPIISYPEIRGPAHQRLRFSQLMKKEKYAELKIVDSDTVISPALEPRDDSGAFDIAKYVKVMKPMVSLEGRRQGKIVEDMPIDKSFIDELIKLNNESIPVQQYFFSRKTLYPKQYRDICDKPNYAEIPAEISSWPEMVFWADRHRGAVFSPVETIEEFKALLVSAEILGGEYRASFGQDSSLEKLDRSGVLSMGINMYNHGMMANPALTAEMPAFTISRTHPREQPKSFIHLDDFGFHSGYSNRDMHQASKTFKLLSFEPTDWDMPMQQLAGTLRNVSHLEETKLWSERLSSAAGEVVHSIIVNSTGEEQSFYIDRLAEQIQKEDPTLTKAEAMKAVCQKYDVKAIALVEDNAADSHEKLMESMYRKVRKYGGAFTPGGKSLPVDLNAKYIKKSFRK